MDRGKMKRLEKAGWTVGTVAQFVDLTKVEEALVGIKAALAEELRRTRMLGRLTQAELAKRMGSSQSRVAKMEAGHPSVSLDLLVHGLLVAGATRRDIASVIGKASLPTA
jgi:DNA-binding XRE family transcriptional regulator